MKRLRATGPLVFAAALKATILLAQMDPLANQIPPLRPARPEIPPTFWEQHGTLVMVGVALLLAIIGTLVWLLTRPKPGLIVPPDAVARHDLESLVGKPEDGAVLSRVSQILRRYITSAFDLPAGEMTTAEFCRTITERDRLGKGLSDELTGFLRECDERKFAPPKPLPMFEAVPKALKLLQNAEARREQLHQAGADLPPTRGAAKGPTP